MNKLFRYMVNGAAAPSDVYTLRRRSYPHKTDTEAMRSDWVRVGEGMNTLMDSEDYRIREAIRIFQERPRQPTFACACLGPRPGEPECPCRMSSIVEVDGIYYQIAGNGPSGLTARRYQKASPR